MLNLSRALGSVLTHTRCKTNLSSFVACIKYSALWTFLLFLLSSRIAPLSSFTQIRAHHLCTNRVLHPGPSDIVMRVDACDWLVYGELFFPPKKSPWVKSWNLRGLHWFRVSTYLLYVPYSNFPS